MTLIEILQGAKDELIKNGWVKGTYNVGEKHCIIGAVATVQNLGSYYSAEGSPAVELLTQLCGINAWGVHGGNVAFWQDMDGRTFADVMDLFDRAILEAKEREAQHASK